jgi:hypothetical protein
VVHGRRITRIAAVVVAVVSSVTAALATVTPAARAQVSGQSGASGEYTPVTPTRVLDTRNGTGGRTGPLGPGDSVTLTVAGVGGVPAAGSVAAVVLNVTVTQPTSASFLSVYPSGGSHPNVSNLNFVPGQTFANLVTVATGSDGAVVVYNDSGTVQVVADLAGYYATDGGPAGSRFHPLRPARVIDTRNGTGLPAALGPGQVDAFTVPGPGGVPGGATAVTLNVTVTGGTTASFLTVYPDGIDPPPTASNVNWVPGATATNLVVVMVPLDGIIRFYNGNGSVHVVADVEGFYDGNRSTANGRFVPLPPNRALDTRGGQPFSPTEQRLVPIASRAGLPASGFGAVMMNVTVTTPYGAGYVTVYPGGTGGPPNTSNVNYVYGQTVPNAVSGATPPNGFLMIGNAGAYVNVIVDVFGYFTGPSLYGFDVCDAPPTSTMAAWKASSPYGVAGVYIGGPMRACPNTLLNSPSWVNTVVGQGWSLIPIYVGRQAPCSGFRVTIDPATAVSEGQNDAADAVAHAHTAGIFAPAPVYLDMEWYPQFVSGCNGISDAVRLYVTGWVIGLHSAGFAAGFYSSLSAGIADEAAGVGVWPFQVPDAIWIAAWNGTPNLTGFPGLSDGLWSGHQRLHQYVGGHDETYGGATLNIDTDVIDGPVAP